MDVKKVISLFGWQGRNTLQGKDLEQANPNYETFQDIGSKSDGEEVVYQNSVIDSAFNPAQGAVGVHTVNAYKKIVYGCLTGDKIRRLEFYRNMASFPEVSDALDEIAESCINMNDDGKIVDLLYSDRAEDLNEDQRKKLTREFDEFISLFRIEDEGFDYFRYFFIDGQITWENIISKKDKTAGIIGINNIPNESYEYLVDVKGKHHGIVVNAKLITDNNDADSSYDIKNSAGYRNNQNTFKNIQFKDMYMRRNQKHDIIPMPMSQITHVNTGIFNTDKTICFPLLERARRPYRQLSLLEDAIIIYRLVRAPERLVFNVDVGKLPAHRAEEVVFKLMQRYQSKRVFNEHSGDVANDYDPHQMLESYWFPKPSDSTGTQVETLGGTVNLGELTDLEYFLRKLYIALKVPFYRYIEPNQTYETGDSITYDEYRFSKFIMRIQKSFSKGLMNTFETHLRLRGLWDKFKLNRRMLYIQFTPPSEYDLYVQQRQFQAKIENYDLLANHEEFSKELAMKKYLNMTEAEIEENNRRVEKERLFQAQTDRKSQNIQDHGSPEELPLEMDEMGNQKDYRW
jgi:hypothetical protein